MCDITYNTWGYILLIILPILIVIALFILLTITIFKIQNIKLGWKILIFVIFLVLFWLLISIGQVYFDTLVWGWKFFDGLRTVECLPAGYL